MSIDEKLDRILELLENGKSIKCEVTPTEVLLRAKIKSLEYSKRKLLNHAEEIVSKNYEDKIKSLEEKLASRQAAMNEQIAKLQNEVRLLYPGAFPIIVRFPDGTVISEVTGSATYLRSIAKIGEIRCCHVAPKYFKTEKPRRADWTEIAPNLFTRTHIMYKDMKHRLEVFASCLAIPITVEIES